MIIVSASRRTDLIAFYPGYLSEVLKKEIVHLSSPFGVKYTVELNPSYVHSIVLWSKNFKNLLKNKHSIKTLLKKYKNPFFLFTVTGFGGTKIEPLIPNYKQALKQLKMLVEEYGSKRIFLRFDPIMFFYDNGVLKSNLVFFEEIVGFSSEQNIKRIIFSFVQYYPKVKKRLAYEKINYYDPPEKEKLKVAKRLLRISQNYGIKLYSCAQDFLLKVKGIYKSKCIDAEYLSRIHPDKISLKHKKDKGQREECGCSYSRDIGMYKMSCPIPCLYCYANPKQKINKNIYLNKTTIY